MGGSSSGAQSVDHSSSGLSILLSRYSPTRLMVLLGGAGQQLLGDTEKHGTAFVNQDGAVIDPYVQHICKIGRSILTRKLGGPEGLEKLRIGAEAGAHLRKQHHSHRQEQEMHRACSSIASQPSSIRAKPSRSSAPSSLQPHHHHQQQQQRTQARQENQADALFAIMQAQSQGSAQLGLSRGCSNAGAASVMEQQQEEELAGAFPFPVLADPAAASASVAEARAATATAAAKILQASSGSSRGWPEREPCWPHIQSAAKPCILHTESYGPEVERPSSCSSPPSTAEYQEEAAWWAEVMQARAMQARSVASSSSRPGSSAALSGCGPAGPGSGPSSGHTGAEAAPGRASPRVWEAAMALAWGFPGAQKSDGGHATSGGPGADGVGGGASQLRGAAGASGGGRSGGGGGDVGGLCVSPFQLACMRPPSALSDYAQDSQQDAAQPLFKTKAAAVAHGQASLKLGIRTQGKAQQQDHPAHLLSVSTLSSQSAAATGAAALQFSAGPSSCGTAADCWAGFSPAPSSPAQLSPRSQSYCSGAGAVGEWSCGGTATSSPFASPPPSTLSPTPSSPFPTTATPQSADREAGEAAWKAWGAWRGASTGGYPQGSDVAAAQEQQRLQGGPVLKPGTSSAAARAAAGSRVARSFDAGRIWGGVAAGAAGGSSSGGGDGAVHGKSSPCLALCGRTSSEAGGGEQQEEWKSFVRWLSVDDANADDAWAV